MDNDIYLIGEVGFEITLDSVVKAVKNSDPKKPLNIHIHSGGGSVYDGIAIYNYLKGLDQDVNTMSAGLVASIATVIFLSGIKETRSINVGDNFLIHLPTGGDYGNAEDLEKVAKELREIENQVAKIYNLETGISIEDALVKMKADEFLSEAWLKENGFVSDIIEFKAVAKLTKSNIKSKNKMSKEKLSKEDKTWFEKLFNKHSKNEPMNKIVKDANDVEIDFTEIEADAGPAVDDTAMIDGEKAEGDYTMPSGEVFKFVGGVLTEIVPAEGSDDTEEVENLKTEISDLKEQLKNNKIENKKVSDSLIEMKSDFKEMKSKIKSSFEWDNKSGRNHGKPDDKTDRSFAPNNK